MSGPRFRFLQGSAPASWWEITQYGSGHSASLEVTLDRDVHCSDSAPLNNTNSQCQSRLIRPPALVVLIILWLRGHFSATVWRTSRPLRVLCGLVLGLLQVSPIGSVVPRQAPGALGRVPRSIRAATKKEGRGADPHRGTANHSRVCGSAAAISASSR
ncbi:hypothetical protein NDU88_006794 [Pleurodeles waltl]|uniref:Uncharacterized protein n=1 Tax=Pleurodeles waltl TaxID=8319 RepID=A0AAV7WHD8_PLEWA|nr:hypothetical protein NDU88_006794 [Pleurodeles waltl]